MSDEPKKSKQAKEFEQIADERRTGLISEFWAFLKHEKKYWLAPIVFVLLLFGLLLVFAQSSAVAPFIYTLF